ncbi:hypothetical protein [Streptomyces sp. NPDC006527]|uniref:hypothetical protein n=1 Tax=Streptomyces sp. NPDC006527 TaxID=3364749 RepID=UPI0036B0EA0A
MGTREAAGHLVKAYALEAPGRTVTEPDADSALRIAAAHPAAVRLRGSLGLTASWAVPVFSPAVRPPGSRTPCGELSGERRTPDRTGTPA